MQEAQHIRSKKDPLNKLLKSIAAKHDIKGGTDDLVCFSPLRIPAYGIPKAEVMGVGIDREIKTGGFQ